MILAPIAALMIQMAISRTREFDTDAAAKVHRHAGSFDQCCANSRWCATGPMADACPQPRICSS
jgi:hypothetical protein